VSLASFAVKLLFSFTSLAVRLFFCLLLSAAFLTLSAAAQTPFPAIESRTAALSALENTDARLRLAGVVYLGRHGLAADGPLLAKRLSDENPVVREVAEQAIWLAWSRSGDAETDRLLETGVAEMSAGHHPRAIEIFSEVVKRSPEFAEGWNKRATAYFLAGDMRKSLADCDEVMKRNPQHFGALSGYGQIYVRLEDYEKAIEYFRRARAVNPNLAGLETVIRGLEELVRERRRRAI
jgi:tetratricopeptide (TPR) repeat protein